MKIALNAITCRALLLTVSMCCIALTAYADDAAVEEDKIVGDAVRGLALYQSTCKHCHTITYDESVVGAPGLKGVAERHDLIWLDQWIQGPEAFSRVNTAAKDLTSSNQFGLIMPTLPAMQDAQKRADVIEFLQTLK